MPPTVTVTFTTAEFEALKEHMQMTVPRADRLHQYVGATLHTADLRAALDRIEAADRPPLRAA